MAGGFVPMGHELSSRERDALKEIANIGSGNAASALAAMTDTKIDITVPSVKIIPFAQVPEILGGAEILSVGIYTQVQVDAPCGLLFVFPLSSALHLVDILLGRPPGTTKEIESLESSALIETANVVGGAYLNALSRLTNITFVPSVPALAIDMVGAIFNSVFVPASVFFDDAIMLETVFLGEDQQVTGHFFLLPQANTLQRILEAIGVNKP